MKKRRYPPNWIRIAAKYDKIYDDYLQLRNETKEKYEEIYYTIPKSYYTNIISKKYNLTPNYVLTILTTYHKYIQEIRHQILINNLNKGIK